MQKIDLEDLLRKYRDGSISEEERVLLENWYLQWKPGHQPIEPGELEEIKADIWAKMPHSVVRKTTPLWPGIAAAASIFLAVTIGGYFLLRPSATNQYTATNHAGEIVPGRSKAILTLANGSKIDLTDAQSGELVTAEDIIITKNDSGQVSYNINSYNNTPPDNATAYNTITTPKGGQWHIVLADGTGVWLNAASSLRYQTSFNGAERKVELSGEGYFEVAKDKEHPFVVQTQKQRVLVLGTHFNVNSYADEPAVRTALLEGAVKLSTDKETAFLKPGQQADLVKGKLNIQEVDVDDVIAWKNGKFVFDNESITSIMRKIARWYDVEVAYQSLPEHDGFSGSLGRSESIRQVLKKIELTNKVHFKITGRSITVSR